MSAVAGRLPVKSVFEETIDDGTIWLVAQVTRRLAILSAFIPGQSLGSPNDTGDPALLTGAFPNGRCWRRLKSEEKLLILHSINSGISAFSSAMDEIEGHTRCAAHTKALQLFTARNSTMGDASEEISRLYEDPANLPIPIALMYAVAASIFNGVSATALQNELAELRGTAQHPRHDLFD